MGAVSIPRVENDSFDESNQLDSEAMSLTRIAAGGVLLAGGCLLLGNYRRAGLAVTVAGAALALLDQQQVVRTCWNRIPDYLDQVQSFLGRVQERVDDFAAKRNSLEQALTRPADQG